MRQQGFRGFSLIELMIVIVIMGILVVLAVPSYQRYTRRAHYAEIVQAAAPYKLGVQECYLLTGRLDDCQAGHYGIPPEIPFNNGIGLVDSITVNHGVVTVIPREKYGIAEIDDYVLTPMVKHDQLVWNRSGGGVDAGYAS